VVISMFMILGRFLHIADLRYLRKFTGRIWVILFHRELFKRLYYFFQFLKFCKKMIKMVRTFS